MARILIIEDDHAVRTLMQRVFEQDGHEVVLAPNGAIGSQLYRKEPADLVVTDIFMPDQEGLETIRQLRREDPQVKIIAISGGGAMQNLDVLALATRLGARRTLTKPLAIRELREAVRQTLES